MEHPYYPNYAEKVDEMERQSMEGRFEVTIECADLKEKILFDKPFLCTNTGGARTSLYAELSQDFTIVHFLRRVRNRRGFTTGEWFKNYALPIILEEAKRFRRY